ncbi:hypothetical protein EDC04DRAFT_3094404 [Pisolithus marmoratus]|nr:hypothetical protein EDC04DRAFT_3094404 [Pisolithus marmoratus]
MTQWRECCCTFQGNSAEGVHNNVGLSLVMLSQLFVPFMNVTIKVLNQIEPPVPTFEVSTIACDGLHGNTMFFQLLFYANLEIYIKCWCLGQVACHLVWQPLHAVHASLECGVLVMGVMIATFAMNAIGAIGTPAHAMHSMAYLSLWCVTVSTVGLFLSREPVVYPTQWQWNVLLLLIGIFTFTQQLTMALQRETAARGTLGVYVQRSKQKQQQEPKVALESGMYCGMHSVVDSQAGKTYWTLQ